MSTASEIHPPQPGATGPRRRRGLSFGRLSVSIQLMVLAVLVGAGLVAMFVLAVPELRETSIGGPLLREGQAQRQAAKAQRRAEEPGGYATVVGTGVDFVSSHDLARCEMRAHNGDSRSTEEAFDCGSLSTS